MTELKQIISEKIKELTGTSLDLEALFELPPDESMGDLAFPCFRLSRELKKAPPVIASELCEKLEGVDGVKSVAAAGGYLNFKIDNRYFKKTLTRIYAKGSDYGKSDIGAGKVMAIDYSSPNIAKKFHIGHLGTTIIGNSIKKLHKFCGYECIGINYLGDWGTQFGKVITAYKLWGSPEKLEKGGMDELVDLYVRFGKEAESDDTLNPRAREEFRLLEQGDEENLKLWSMFKQISLDEYQKTYKKLGIEFESYNGESFYNDKMAPVVEELRNDGLLEKDAGAEIVRLDKYNMPPVIILKSDGSTIYATRDIAAAIWRYNNYKFDKCIYVTSAGQSLHFAQWFKVIEMMGYEWADRLIHVPYGTFSFGGEKIASRTGNVVLLEDLFNDAVEKALEVIERKNPEQQNKKETAEAVGIGAVVFNSLLSGRIKDVNFNWEEALSFEGNTGPYVQYTYARTASILRKAGEQGEFAADGGKADYEPNDDEVKLIKCLSEFPEKVLTALKDYEPSVITRYALEVCWAFNGFYHSSSVLKAQGDAAVFRLLLTKAANSVLGNALELIGLRKTEVL